MTRVRSLWTRARLALLDWRNTMGPYAEIVGLEVALHAEQRSHATTRATRDSLVRQTEILEARRAAGERLLNERSIEVTALKTALEAQSGRLAELEAHARLGGEPRGTVVVAKQAKPAKAVPAKRKHKSRSKS